MLRSTGTGRLREPDQSWFLLPPSRPNRRRCERQASYHRQPRATGNALDSYSNISTYAHLFKLSIPEDFAI